MPEFFMVRPSTFQFLEQLGSNNNRDWFQAHKSEHDAARGDVLVFTGEVLRGLSAIDPLISADLRPANCVLRIYRDIRFSKDKTPYKTHFGVGISPTAKNFSGPGYYIHLEPGRSFVTAGCWMPEREALHAIRQEIDYNSVDFHEILAAPAFSRFFGGLDQEERLKTAPKGYSADHPDIEFLRLKSFTASAQVRDEVLLGDRAVSQVLVRMEALYPLMQFLRNALS